MDDPIFLMRAKVASRAKGHVFEERFLKLNGIPLVVAYRQALREEEKDHTLIRVLNDAWTKRFEHFFKVLYMFTDMDRWVAIEQMKELEGLRGEINAEEFPDIWEEIMSVIPSTVIIEEPKADPFMSIPKLDPTLEEILTGFVPYKIPKEGD